MTPDEIQQTLDRLLLKVQRPARYTGGELNEIVKSWEHTPMRVALAFPDIYDLGMPNLGLTILYDIVNKQPEMLAERVYLPWVDMGALMREAQLPLYSLESKHALCDFDLIGISLPYESLYTNTLELLDLGGVARRSAERGPGDPVVVAGGHATYNPEPMADFIDAFVIGEGEEVILELARTVQQWKARGGARDELYRALARLEGVYVPSLYRPSYHDDGTIAGVEALAPEARLPVKKRIVARLPPPPTRFIVPFLDVVHNRAAIEIMRGCTRGCRFCHAGMITRPVRERPVAEVIEALATALESTGFDEVGLLSLSSSDYEQVLPLVQQVAARFGSRRLNISLPSLRIESVSIDLMDALQGSSRRSGFTLAPEAASERMREIINKPVSTAQVLETARGIFERGWKTIKLYFMIGHPSETLEDVEEICRLARAVLAEGRRALGNRARVNVGVGTFVPKPHTPFQWVPCDTPEQVAAKHRVLQRGLRGNGLKVSWNHVEESLLEAWLTRGDRRVGAVIESAWRRGARFDAWQEHFRYDLWQEAFAEVGLVPDFYTHRVRAQDELFPWDHIDAIDKAFLLEDYQWSLEGRTRVDCRDKCFACGILPGFKELRRVHRGDVWKCPDVGRAPDSARGGAVDTAEVPS